MAPPQKPLRLAVLICDVPAPAVVEKFGTYEAIFPRLLTKACSPDPLESHLTITTHQVVTEDQTADNASYPDLDSIDGILITGSKYSAYEDAPWILRLVEYTKKCLDSGRIRTVGVCFGHQIVGRALGCDVGRSDLGWELSVVEHELTDEGKTYLGMDKLRLHHMHRDIVRTYPEGSIPLARTGVCEVQAFVIPRKAICVQGHPEFSGEIVSDILSTRKYGGILTDEIYEDGMKRVHNEHDGVAVAKVFLRFLEEP